MFFVFAEIQGLGLGGDALTGVIFEFAAFFFRHDHAFFHTQDLIFVNHRAVGTVKTGARYFFSEQHMYTSASK